MAQIKVSFAGKLLSTHPLDNGGEYLIGCSEDADIVLDAAVVEPLHARIVQGKSQQWEMQALSETYFLLRGKKKDHAVLVPDEDIKIGPFAISIETEKNTISMLEKFNRIEPKKRTGILVAVFSVLVLMNILIKGDEEDGHTVDSGLSLSQTEKTMEVGISEVSPLSSDSHADSLDEINVGGELILNQDAVGTMPDSENKDSLRVKRLRAKYISWAEGFINKEDYKEAIVRLNAGLGKLNDDPMILDLLINTKARYAKALIKEADFEQVLRVIKGKGEGSAVLESIKLEAEKKLKEGVRRQKYLAVRQKEIEHKVFVVEKSLLTDEFEAGQILLKELLADSELSEMSTLREKVLTLASRYEEKQIQTDLENALVSKQAESKQTLLKTRYKKCLELKREKKYMQAKTACRDALLAAAVSGPEWKEVKLLLSLLEKNTTELEFKLLKEAAQCEANNRWKCTLQKLQMAKMLNSKNTEITRKIETILTQQRARARALYQDGLAYESVGDLSRANQIWREVIALLPESEAYNIKAKTKLGGFQ